MHVLAVELDLRLPYCQSLKEKRSVLRPVLEGLCNRHSVAVSEVDHQDLWQRAAIGTFRLVFPRTRGAALGLPLAGSRLMEDA